jgi:hypothetical protein
MPASLRSDGVRVHPGMPFGFPPEYAFSFAGIPTVALRGLAVRTYIAEPERGVRNWDGKAAEKEAVYANRRRVGGERGKRLQRGRGEKVERNFAHQFDTGGMDRLWVRGRENVYKKLLIQAAACNLALLMRSIYGAGKPKAAHDRIWRAVFAILAFMKLVEAFWPSPSGHSGYRMRKQRTSTNHLLCCRALQNRMV